MLNIELRAAKTGTPGQGELRIQGWKEDLHGLELAVQRNQDDYYLDDRGQWSASQHWNALVDVRAQDDRLLAAVGPWLVDPLTADRRMTYMFYLRSPDGSDKGVLRIVGELLGSAAADTSAAPEIKPAPPPEIKPSPQAAPEPELEPEPEPEPQVESASEPQAASALPETPLPSPPPPPSRWPLWVLLLALILSAAGLAWWFLLRSAAHTPSGTTPVTSQDAAANAPPSAESAESAATSPCDPQILGANPDDLALLQACVRSNPSSAQVLELIRAAKDAKRCNLMQRLYAYTAQAGDAVVALAYAREYDPEQFKSGGCIQAADSETAAYWYELVLEREPGNGEAKRRLEALKP